MPNALIGCFAVVVSLAGLELAGVPPGFHGNLTHDSAQATGTSPVLPVWLAGRWEGSGFGGWAEEMWMPPRGGPMVGTFRLSVGGKPQIFEFMTLSVEDGQPVIRVKHFNADSSPWEDRDVWVMFPYERSTEHGIFFGGLTYELLEPEKLRVTVHVGRSDGTSETEELILQKVGPE